jgi:hypothetical protein
MDYDRLSHEARDLILFAENTEPVYKKELHIQETLDKRMQKGSFNRDLAIKPYEWLAEEAAKSYVRELKESKPWYTLFNPRVRKEAAAFMRDAYVASYPSRYASGDVVRIKQTKHKKSR